MDDLDRLYRRLIHNIRASHPEYLTIPFTVQELYESLVPYRHNRRELAIETNQDYEATIARLLSGEQNYVQADPAVTEALKRELASPTGDPGIFKEYAHAELSLVQSNNFAVTGGSSNAATMNKDQSPPAADSTTSQQKNESTEELSKVSSVDSSVGPTTATAAEQKTVAQSPGTPAQQTTSVPIKPIPSLLESLTHIPVPTGCRFCSGTLPDDREVSYCPHCGENLKTKRCPACSGEMDATWRFCVTCGRRSA